VRAWERLPGFRGESSVGTWLHRLGVNVILDFLRASRRDALRFAGDDAIDVTTAPATVSADDIAEQIDLEAALDRLPGGARAVLVLHDIQGYSHEEIAQMTRIAAGTSRAQLWRARRQLARMLDP
jgi:RNA polymerase sigma-70 factor (ECF subfamily)